MTGQPAARAVAADLLRPAGEAGLPPADVEQVRVLIAADELQLALETLCTQAYEYDVELSPSQREALQELGEMLDVSVYTFLVDSRADPPRDNTPQ